MSNHPPPRAADKRDALDTREVAGKGKRRKRGGNRGRRSPMRQIQRKATARQGAWVATQQAAATTQLSKDLDALYVSKRAQEKGDGPEFRRPYGKADAGEVLAARRTRKREGEVLPVVTRGNDGA